MRATIWKWGMTFGSYASYQAPLRDCGIYRPDAVCRGRLVCGAWCQGNMAYSTNHNLSLQAIATPHGTDSARPPWEVRRQRAVLTVGPYQRMVSSCSLALCVRDVCSSRRRRYLSSHDRRSISAGQILLFRQPPAATTLTPCLDYVLAGRPARGPKDYGQLFALSLVHVRMSMGGRPMTAAKRCHSPKIHD